MPGAGVTGGCIMDNRVNRHLFGAIISIVFLLFFMAPRQEGLCGELSGIHFSGRTMGTTYTVKVLAPAGTRADFLKNEIEKVLEHINQSMSTYRFDSEISRFNRFKRTDRPFRVSEDFLRVIKTGRLLFESTGGAWDATVKPLVDAWGFSGKRKRRIPTAGEIDRLRGRTGFDRILIRPDGRLVKTHPDVTLDFASIAKGYAVDRIAARLRKNRLERFIVEVGGEVYAEGLKAGGRPWRAGINLPDKTAAVDRVYLAVPLTNQALATSGDYRKFFTRNGRQYTHVIDPATGYPVTHGVVSASVIAGTCVFADGLATALMVMEPAEGIALVNRLPGVECLLVVRGPGGAFTEYSSRHFPR